MRKPVIAGNWKMYKTVGDAVATAVALKPLVANANHCQVVIAPVFRSKLPESERLSISELVRALDDRGISARAAASIDDIVATSVKEHRAGDVVVLMSNGGFGGIHQQLLRALAQ